MIRILVELLEDVFRVAAVDLMVLLTEDQLGRVLHEVEASLLKVVRKVKVDELENTFDWLCLLNNYWDD